jgi:hypothetical protein
MIFARLTLDRLGFARLVSPGPVSAARVRFAGCVLFHTAV